MEHESKQPADIKDTLPYPAASDASDTPPPTDTVSDSAAEPRDDASSDPAAVPADLDAVARARTIGDRLLRHGRPLGDQAWLNIQVWIPALLNPPLEACKVTYWAREHRDAMTWKIALPKRCWHCSTDIDLRRREYDRRIRSFQAPLPIAGTAAGIFLLLLAIAYLFGSWKFGVLAVVSVVVGIAVIWLKSWEERVRLLIWTCDQHADELTRPRYVVDQNELVMFLPTESLAEITRADLKEERRGRAAKAGIDTSSPATERPTRPATEGHAPPPPPPVKPRDLPPIKLAGDEEDD